MKLLFILFAVLLSVASSAAPHYHRTRPRVPAATRFIRAVPWKTVAAGGAAAGTVIAAYKVSDGVEEGMKISAKEKPEVFPQSFAVITWPIRWAAFVLFLLSGCWITKNLLKLKTTSPIERIHHANHH